MKTKKYKKKGGSICYLNSELDDFNTIITKFMKTKEINLYLRNYKKMTSNEINVPDHIIYQLINTIMDFINISTKSTKIMLELFDNFARMYHTPYTVGEITYNMNNMDLLTKYKETNCIYIKNLFINKINRKRLGIFLDYKNTDMESKSMIRQTIPLWNYPLFKEILLTIETNIENLFVEFINKEIDEIYLETHLNLVDNILLSKIIEMHY